MKSFALFLLSLIFTSSLLAQSNQEFRAIWVVDSQWLTAGDSESENKALIREILDNHQKANMTSVLWQVRRFGTVYYKSNIEPWGPQTGFSEPGYDPLAYALEQAHARGLEFHAWMNVFESRHAYAGSPAQRHPNWIARDQAGTPMPQDLAWLSPGLADVRDYLKNIALEIVNNYDIDGLHLDFVRWSEHTSSSHSLALAKQNMERDLPDGFITAAQLEELQNNAAGRFLYDVNHPFSAGVPAGFNSWPEWWRWSVTEFVRAVHDSIQAVKPWVRLSPAALGRYNWGGWQGFDVVYQDAALWLNERYIDQLIGMHYHWSVPQDFYSVLVGGCPNCWSQFIQPAIQAGQLYSVGLFSDSFSDRNIFNRHQSIVERVRQVSWVDGLQFFSQKSWQDRKYWDTAKSLFFKQKTKIRATRLIDDTAPSPPTFQLTKIDSLRYQVTVTPAASITTDHWFAIYRSPNDVLRADSDEIIDIHFGSTPYSFTDAFAGTQDFNGKYHYFATAFDRFWNESTLSNSAVSDSIPSFAPQILLTSPAVGDTIPVNQPISLTFSKTMDTNSFLGAVALAPALTVNKLNWSDDQKTVTILTAGAFEYATEYTLTVAADVTDINGKALDGNGDGVSGDDFELRFHTLAQDITGPQLIFSFPDFKSQETNFAIDEVMTFVFDELVDNSSVA
ncbi:MAG: family 10 glycosylhydrolase, partial [bacterium]